MSKSSKKKAKGKKASPSATKFKIQSAPPKPKLSKRLQEEFISFLEYHPAKKVSQNLRRMVIDYLMHTTGRESIYIGETLLQLDSLFELLDVAELEWKEEAGY